VQKKAAIPRKIKEQAVGPAKDKAKQGQGFGTTPGRKRAGKQAESLAKEQEIKLVMAPATARRAKAMPAVTGITGQAQKQEEQVTLTRSRRRSVKK
jgi:hypothetical protein